MIPFFRKLRKKMADDNKPIKYARYAIGEIVLVVIGILIALQINNANEARKQEIKIEIVLREVLEELSTNIKIANNGIEFSFKKDSSFQLVRKNRLRQIYVSNNLNHFMSLPTYYNYGTFTQNGYDNLINNLNIIPIEYKSILKKLNILYGTETRFVVKYSDLIEETANNNLRKRADNYEWFSSPKNPDLRQDKVNYILNDYKYKNEVEHFYRIGTIHNHYLMTYISKSLLVYNEIASLLNVPTLDEYNKTKVESAKVIVGEWKNTSFPDDLDNFIFKIKDNRLYSYYVADTNEVSEEFILSTKKINSKTILNVLSVGEFFTYIIEGDSLSVSYELEEYSNIRINKN